MIYLVKRDPKYVDYGEYDAFVVRAKSKMEARELCNDTGFHVKYDPLTITLIEPEGKSEKILGSFNAG